MKHLMIVILLTAVSFSIGKSQGIAAPIAAMPTQSNKVLIDTFLSVSHFESYFNTYCNQRIEQIGKEKNWSVVEIQNRKRKIDYNDFKTDIIYNIFSDISRIDLGDLILLFRSLNEHKSEFFFFVNHTAIQANLDGFISKVL